MDVLYLYRPRYKCRWGSSHPPTMNPRRNPQVLQREDVCLSVPRACVSEQGLQTGVSSVLLDRWELQISSYLPNFSVSQRTIGTTSLWDGHAVRVTLPTSASFYFPVWGGGTSGGWWETTCFMNQKILHENASFFFFLFFLSVFGQINIAAHTQQELRASWFCLMWKIRGCCLGCASGVCCQATKHSAGFALGCRRVGGAGFGVWGTLCGGS